MRTLIAVEDAKESWDAVRFAQDLLRDDDEVVVMNVARPERPGFAPVSTLTGYGSPFTGYQYSPPVHEPRADADSSSDGDEVVVEFAAGALDADSSIVRRGDVASTICEAAEELEVDMIIVGTRDHGLVRRLLSGSVSREVLDRSPCPVLVVK